MKKIFSFKFSIFCLKKFQKGTTIVELLLYMGILSILLTVLTSIFTSALDVQSESTATSSVEQDGNYILARLAYDIHRSQGINTPSLGSAGNSFQIVIDGINYTYSVDANGNLILVNNFGTDNINNYNSNISNFTVRHLGNAGKVEDTLAISFTVVSRTQQVSGLKSEDFQTNLSLRRQ